MQVGTWAGVITAVFTSIIAFGGVIATVKVWLPSKKLAVQTALQTIEIHQIVNQQRTDMQRWIKVLEATLAANDITLPEDQSKVLD